MRQTLRLHPESRCKVVHEIAVSITRPWPNTLVFDYRVSGIVDALRLAPVSFPARSDDLWQHTCFEAFIRPSASPSAAYYEFNFAPSTQWAAYQFAGYRKDMSNLRDMDVPRIEVESDDKVHKLTAMLELAQLPDLLQAEGLQLGLSAVIEETNGNKSYWALAHPPGKADFHHEDGFSFTLPTAAETAERT